MIRIREAIIVEGKYDVNTVKQLVDTIVIPTGGFRIYQDKSQLRLLQTLALERGLIVLTDSDGAGFQIRNYLKSSIPQGRIKHAYIPDLFGKENRKKVASKEGKLGVEGMRPEVLLSALRAAGATIMEEDFPEATGENAVTKADLFEHGLSGTAMSAERRKKVLRALQLPERMSANALLEYLNGLQKKDAFFSVLQRLGY